MVAITAMARAETGEACWAAAARVAALVEVMAAEARVAALAVARAAVEKAEARAAAAWTEVTMVGTVERMATWALEVGEMAPEVWAMGAAAVTAQGGRAVAEAVTVVAAAMVAAATAAAMAAGLKRAVGHLPEGRCRQGRRWCREGRPVGLRWR